MVRAKFRVNSITRFQGSTYVDGKYMPSEVQTIRLSAVSDGSEEKKKFFASTPTGTIELATVNPDAVKAFELFGEFYVDFTPAGK